VHKNIAEQLLPMAAEQLLNAGVELRGCPETMRYVAQCNQATVEDYATEFHSLILSVKVVESMEEAILHIRRYGTKHSEVIVTNDYANARKFQQMVDAAVVYVNASSRFSDGFQFGFGAEIGISTQKLHARGPMGLKALTSYKYIVNGDGQVRK
ncbi:MAG: gamma-glutamyl-phosphate reductase, partial [Peptococcaceae bacterium]|nr:gamma-glutamyl-phosphate reductase [Peptococcaceae bacterium]